MKQCQPKNIANWILGDISKYLNESNKPLEETALTSQNLADLIENVEKGVISNSAGKTVLDVILEQDKKVSDVISEKGLAQISDSSALEETVKEVLAANEKSIQDYKNGKDQCVWISGRSVHESEQKGRVIRTLSKN